jgi:hypothetical protein
MLEHAVIDARCREEGTTGQESQELATIGHGDKVAGIGG